MEHVKKFEDFLKENVTVSNPNTPEYRFKIYIDGILEDLDRISKSAKTNQVTPQQIAIELDATYNMIINDSHYVFNPERFPTYVDGIETPSTVIE